MGIRERVRPVHQQVTFVCCDEEDTELALHRYCGLQQHQDGDCKQSAVYAAAEGMSTELPPCTSRFRNVAGWLWQGSILGVMGKVGRDHSLQRGKTSMNDRKARAGSLVKVKSNWRQQGVPQGKKR